MASKAPPPKKNENDLFYRLDIMKQDDSRNDGCNTMSDWSKEYS